jgi:hypothetical protein
MDKFTNPILWIGISIGILIISKYVFKIDYINIFDIVEKHIGNFRNQKTNKILIVPFFIYFIVPFIIGASICKIKLADKDIIENITVILSIFTSMLFTLLALVIDLKGKIESRNKSDGAKIRILKELLKETYYTIMFEIIVAVVLLILTFAYMLAGSKSIIVTTLVYSLLFLFIFNLLIVLKRIFLIYQEELK